MVRRIIVDALPLIPNLHRAAGADAVIQLESRMSKGRTRPPFQQLTLARADGDDYYGIVLFDSAASPAIRQWLTLFGNDACIRDYSRTTLRRVDTMLANQLQPPVADDDEDDLDAIEKAARRTLHGDRNIPNTSLANTLAQEGDIDEDTSYRRAIARDAQQLHGIFLGALARLAARLVREGWGT
jgi:hypothetical protein